MADFAEWPTLQQGRILLLVMKCRTSLAFASTALTSKAGDDGHSIRFICSFFRQLGHRRIIMRSDGEPALKLLLENAVTATPSLEAVMKNSAPGDAAQNGTAERAVGEIKAHCRVLLADLVSRYPLLDAAHVLLPWIPRHVGNCLTRYRVLEDGRTAHWRLTGRRFARPAIRFGEVVHFVATGSRHGSGA